MAFYAFDSGRDIGNAATRRAGSAFFRFRRQVSPFEYRRQPPEAQTGAGRILLYSIERGLSGFQGGHNTIKMRSFVRP
jgi:hypothetical protein